MSVPSVAKLDIVQSLAQHQKTHTEEKPYHCNKCESLLARAPICSASTNSHWREAL